METAIAAALSTIYQLPACSSIDLTVRGDDLADTVLGRGDFMKAASLPALLDTHSLTTRSNTFMV